MVTDVNFNITETNAEKDTWDQFRHSFSSACSTWSRPGMMVDQTVQSQVEILVKATIEIDKYV